MTSNPPIKLGQEGYVELINDGSDDIGSLHPGKIHHLDDTTLVLALASAPSVPLPSGARVNVFFPASSMLFSFESTISKATTDAEVLLYIKLPPRITPVDKARFVRMDVDLPIRLRTKDSPQPESFTGIVENLSGSGLLFSTDWSLTIGVQLDAEFDLDSRRSITAQIRVARTSVSRDQEKMAYGVDFCAMDKKDRDRLLSFLFQKQREARRKRLE